MEELSEQWHHNADIQSYTSARQRPQDLKYAPGTCKICGLHFDVILKIHAQKHGFKDEYEMIEKNQIRFDFERKKRCLQKT